MLLQGGVSYLSLVIMLTTATLILDLRASGGVLQRLLSGLTLPISGLMTARFLLDLRRWQDKRASPDVLTQISITKTTVLIIEDPTAIFRVMEPEEEVDPEDGRQVEISSIIASGEHGIREWDSGEGSSSSQC